MIAATVEEVRVADWRWEELFRAGYDEDAAARLAERHDVDLHIACRLLKNGCPQETALRILL